MITNYSLEVAILLAATTWWQITNYSLEVAILLAATTWWQKYQSAFWQHESRGIHQRHTYQSTFSNRSTVASGSPSGKLNLESQTRRGVSSDDGEWRLVCNIG